MKKTINLSDIKIGILGGGQLGKMLCSAAVKWHLETMILNPALNCPASLVCKNIYGGDCNDYETVYQFGKRADIITIEIENVNTDALIRLQEEGKIVHPDPHKLKIIQDKGLQKDFLSKCNLNSPSYILCENTAQVKEGIAKGAIAFPFVQKLRRAGYDGKGVAVINSAKDIPKLMDAPSVIEKKVQIKKELSVIASGDKSGNVKCFAPVEMVFDKQANLVNYLICPAEVDEHILKSADKLAVKTIKALDIAGLLAVEMFLTEDNELFINEVAPRPHNSGHHTIEASITSQYEQHLRAILGLPLGSTDSLAPAVMMNILGEPGYSGTAMYTGLEKCLEVEGANIHLYGKTETKPYRKMGHVTILDRSINGAKNKLKIIKKQLKVIA